MRTFKHLVIFALVALVAVFLAAPSAMAKKQLAEDELELITAAGQPKVVESDGSTSPIFFSDVVEVNLVFDTNVQMSLTALSLNNVAGENQLATGINIENSGNTTTSSQSVSIVQSWGAIKDITAVMTSSAGGAGCSTSAEKCILTKGGNASSKGFLVSMLADQIIASNGDNSQITVTQTPQFDLAFATGSQQSLAALVVNNIAGLNQVATGVNITASGLNIGTFGGGTGVTASAGGGIQGAQSVAIEQWRGVAKSRPAFTTP